MSQLPETKRTVRLGRQTPTLAYVLPYQETHGDDAVELYEQGERHAMEWQTLLIYDIMATNEYGLWTHTKFGISLPRRNGKTELFIIRELWGLMHGEKILHTAHRTSTSHSAWERLCSVLDTAKIVYKSVKAKGAERIEVPETGGRIDYRTRTSTGGLGEGFDLLVVDEAQEYTDAEASALTYVVGASRNPQTIFCGTPPTLASSGTVFSDYRQSVIKGEAYDSGWAEWSVEFQVDPNDIEAWYQTNPSLGNLISERTIRSEIGKDVLDFCIQRLGFWVSFNIKSTISAVEWERLKVEALPKLRGKLYAGVKYGQDGKTVAMSIAIKTTEGKVFVECIDCRPIKAGNAWIVKFLEAADVARVAIDGAGHADTLVEAMKRKKLRRPLQVLPTVAQVIAANAAFADAVNDETLCHMGQPSVVQIATNCDTRAIGGHGGFGYRSIKPDVAVEILDSIILAHWLCQTARPARTQKVYY